MPNATTLHIKNNKKADLNKQDRGIKEFSMI